MVDVSVIIVNYNTEQLVLDCIDSIIKETKGLSYEIIIIDNASPQKPIKLPTLSRVRYIESSVNIGFGKGNNLGAKYAKGKYLFCLNPDTILLNNAIAILFRHMEGTPQTGVCGGNLFTMDMKPTHSFEMIPPSITSELVVIFSFFNKLKNGGVNRDFNHTNKPLSVAFIVGADLFIRTNLYNEIGGFDEDFFMYFEETYLCYQVKKQGYDVVNIPQAHIIHLVGKSSPFQEEKEKTYLHSRKKYLIKRYNKTYYMACNIIYVIACLSRILLFGILHNNSKMVFWINKLKSFLR